MKIKFGMAVLVLGLGMSVHAADAPLLKYYWSNGTVAPQYRLSKTCDIFADKVVKVSRGGVVGVVATTTKVAYTSEIKDADAILKQVKKAKKGKVESKQGPMGGPTISYTAPLSSDLAAVELVLKSTNAKETLNKSKAAKRLVRFIDFNCNQQ